MVSIPVPPNEEERVTALKSYGILDTAPEAEYDAVTKLASEICRTPISLITLLDEKRQWFKSAHGAGDVKGSPKEWAFCAHAILHPEQPMTVPDLRRDSRFAANPFVTEDPRVVFYAGVPLTDGDGFPLGTLCVLDVEERTLNDFQLNALRTLAGQVVTLLALRRRVNTLQTFQKLLEERNEEMHKGLNAVLHQGSVLTGAVAALDRLRQQDSLTDEDRVVVDAVRQLVWRASDALNEAAKAV